jgi:3-deoxy-D-manno-octulosonic-acid transferase
LELAERDSEARFPVTACPLDLGPTVRRAFSRTKPAALVLVETELWPGLLAEAHRRSVHVAVINARISDRSMNRFHLLKSLVGPLLRGITVGAQDDENARRFVALGVEPSLATVIGNMKYDMVITSNYDRLSSMLRTFLPDPNPPLWVAGSVREGEESAVLQAHSQLRQKIPQARLLLAPRHLDRIPTCIEECRRLGFRFVRRSDLPSIQWDVLLLDTIGELLSAYGLGDVAFVGGSLVPQGGQNLLEPAFLSKPILFGPSTENFRLEAERLEDSGGGFRVDSPETLASQLEQLLSDKGRRLHAGDRSHEVLAAHRGAASRAADLVVDLVSRSG